MSYSDDYKDTQRDEFLNRWTPADKPLPPLTPENFRYNIARAREMEHELKEIRATMAAFRKLLGR